MKATRSIPTLNSDLTPAHVLALQRVVSFAASVLPDSFARRKELLADMLLALPSDRSILRGRLSEMLTLLNAHEDVQLNLALDFPQLNNPALPSGTNLKSQI
jgi:hypothetical protein